MFYQKLSEALKETDLDWLAMKVGMSKKELQMKVKSETLTFEECIAVTRQSGSLELLKYVINLFNSQMTRSILN